jgi:hypothetical protein
MKKLFTYIVLILCTKTLLLAQDNVDVNNMVGFGCYYEGRLSKPVVKVTKELKKRNYKAVARLLNSNNNAERFMAVITLERLAASGKYVLSEKEKELISGIKESDEDISVCSGCTYFDTVPLKKMFSQDFQLFAANWLEHNIKAP